MIMGDSKGSSRSQKERAFKPTSQYGIDHDLALTPKYDVFNRVISGLRDGEEMVLTPQNVYANDRFLIFSGNRNKQKVSFHRRADGVWRVSFDGDDPMLLENTPASFWRTILKNMK